MGDKSLEAQFQHIADVVEQQQSDRVVTDAITATHALCVEAAARSQRAQVRTLLTNVQTALETWQTVWPKLGAQRDFRQAVAREAHLWARKFGELAHDR